MNTPSSVDANPLGDEPISAELIAAITAAAVVFVGRRMRIRGLEQLHSPHEAVSKWSRQGRVLVQASHNLPVKHQPHTR